MTKIFKAALAATLLVAPAAAQADGFGGEINVARADRRWGVEAGIGHDFAAGPITVRPFAGVLLYDKDDPRYEWEPYADGRDQCFDTETGQPTDKGHCATTALRGYGKLEAAYAIPMGPEVGVGVRLSSYGMQPYAMAGTSLLPKLRADISAGAHYVALGLRAGF